MLGGRGEGAGEEGATDQLVVPRPMDGLDRHDLPHEHERTTFRIGDLREELPIAGLELDGPRAVGHAKQRAARGRALQRIEHRRCVARLREDPQHEVGHCLGHRLTARRQLFCFVQCGYERGRGHARTLGLASRETEA